MTTMHVGTFDTARLRSTLSPDVGFILDGDSWEEWGEPLDLDTGHPSHAMLVLPDSIQLLVELSKILDEEPGLLVPMVYTNQRGILACITSEEDWSEPSIEVVDVQSKRWLERRSREQDRNMWLDLAWQDRLAGND